MGEIYFNDIGKLSDDELSKGQELSPDKIIDNWRQELWQVLMQ